MFQTRIIDAYRAEYVANRRGKAKDDITRLVTLRHYVNKKILGFFAAGGVEAEEFQFTILVNRAMTSIYVVAKEMSYPIYMNKNGFMRYMCSKGPEIKSVYDLGRCLVESLHGNDKTAIANHKYLAAIMKDEIREHIEVNRLLVLFESLANQTAKHIQ